MQASQSMPNNQKISQGCRNVNVGRCAETLVEPKNCLMDILGI